MMRTRLAASLLALALAAGGARAADPLEVARSEAALAAALVESARDRLAAAVTGEDRLAALAEAAAAHERGLAAMRGGLREVARRRAILQERLDAERAQTETALALLMGMERTPDPAVALSPGGPVAHLRAGHALSVIGPALRARAEALAARAAEADALADARDALQARMRVSLAALQDARAAQAEALRERDGARAPLPVAARKALREGGWALKDFAALLGDDPLPAPTPPEAPDWGALPLPVSGAVTASFGAPDADGFAREGIEIAAPPWAQVLAPFDAALRFAGPLDGYGQVAILEPAPGRLLILAGLGAVLREQGASLRAGEPVAQLGVAGPDSPEFLIEAQRNGGAISDRTLYLEAREDGAPVDPARWFRLGAD
ncbi:murein hydrolase activator EnvC family protein [Rhodovulum sp. DZ06]|uniref:murein hydrolase activator EnvC family protein n=1 Tax=Rhodovulum sp. DZ06 TaxID=3425126 RepID=UPI003D3279A6